MLEQMFRNMPGVVKNLLIINVIMFLATFLLKDLNLLEIFGLHYFDSPDFQPYQIVTSFFSHANFAHILFNMFGLVMFGAVLERVWGEKKFLLFYLSCALGATFIHLGISAFQLNQVFDTFTPVSDGILSIDGYQLSISGEWIYENKANITESDWGKIKPAYGNLVGASGAISGLFVAFAYLFPNTELQLMFIPVPVKAKYLVPFLLLIDLYLGVGNFEWDNIAHFAHLGGALIGFIMVLIWQRNKINFY